MMAYLCGFHRSCASWCASQTLAIYATRRAGHVFGALPLGVKVGVQKPRSFFLGARH
jgi:hypothetical protein